MLKPLPSLPELKRYLFVLNPISGERDKSEVYSIIKKLSAEHKWTCKIFRTTGNNDCQQLKNCIAQFDPEVVVAIGGDGTVSLVAQILEGTDRILGIIPAGSGNGLSKDLKIPQNNYKAAFEALLHGYVTHMDTLRANHFFFLHLADIGFNAHIVKLFNRSKGRGLWTYIKFVLKEFFTYPTHYYTVTTDNGSFSGNAFMITVANSNQFGSNLTINPNGHWGDGKFEVIIIKRFQKKQAFRLFFRLLTKRIIFSPHCVVLSCTKAHIRCEKRTTLQYDGETAKKVRDVHFSIKPASLQLIVPASTPQLAERIVSVPA